MTEKIIFNWSSGKDSALALYELMKNEKYEVTKLLTTITGDYDRISIHGVRRSLLLQQVKSIGIPLDIIELEREESNKGYETKMRKVLGAYKSECDFSMAFGDIFLEDLRKYREDALASMDIPAIFPLWKRDTLEMSRDFIDRGFKAIVTCVDSHQLSGEFSGREYSLDFLNDLPQNVDPCGENGEFHTFTYDGPIFTNPVHFKKGVVEKRSDRFYFCDLEDVNE